MQSSAVAHFEALSREKASFEKSTKDADRERARVEARLQALRTTKEKLERQSRQLADKVGHLNQQKQSYTNEKARIEKVLKEERAALEQCAKDTEILVTQERTRKSEFCEEMSALNDELTSLLMQQEEMRLRKMISVATIPMLVEAAQKGTETGQVSDLQNAAILSEESVKESEALDAQKQMLEQKIAQLRETATQTKIGRGEQPFCESSLVELEEIWGQTADESNAARDEEVHREPPVHMQLFYGAASIGPATSDSATTL